MKNESFSLFNQRRTNQRTNDILEFDEFCIPYNFLLDLTRVGIYSKILSIGFNTQKTTFFLNSSEHESMQPHRLFQSMKHANLYLVSVKHDFTHLSFHVKMNMNHLSSFHFVYTRGKIKAW